MPIIGLTDRTPSFKELGRLRLGIPKSEAAVSGPREISYFRPDFRPDAGEAVEQFTKIYGDKPTRINIRFPFTQVERVWDAFYMCYNKSGLLGMADGQKWLYLRNNQTSELLVKDGMPSQVSDKLPVDSNGLPYLPFDKKIPVYSYKSKAGADVAVFAKPEGRLKVLVPELKQAAYMTVITHSIYNVMRISEQMAGIEQIARNAGMSLPLVPVVLSRRKELISVSIDGKKAMQEHYLLNVEIDPDWMEAQFKYLNALLPGVTPLPVKLSLPAWTDNGVPPEDLSEDESGEEVVPPGQEAQPKASEQSANGLTFLSALQVKTPKGSALGDLTDEQMTLLQLKANGDIQKAAEYLLGVAIADDGDFDTYFNFLSLAQDKKIAVPPLPEKVTRIQLWREMQKLIELTK